ncbi:MAG: LPXTG cell wall anchor domain-containing protein [Cytophagales bacterium]|nr:LPXTG cell wall anchor domain-containing protein [Cytophagales bacterium]
MAHVADFTKDSSERGRTVSARTRTEKRPVHYPASESVELVAAQVRTVVTHGPNTGYVRENDLLVVFGGVLLSSTLLTYALRRRTKALSHWASRQPWKTRTLLTLIHLGTAFGSIALGKWYGDQGMLLSQNTLYAALTVFGLGTLLYPRAGTVSNRYQRRKIHDSLLFASATFLMLYTGNHEIPVAYTNGTQPREIFTGVSAKARSTQATAGEGRPQKGRLIGLKIILSLLAAALYVFLTLAVLALSCSLFCSGSGGLGLLVLVGGAAAVNFLGVVLIRAVWSIRTKVKPE